MPAATLNPAAFGIGNGVDRPVGLPQMIVAGGLNFGGPAIYPQGRDDTLYVFNDTVTLRRRPRIRCAVGGEYRRFLNDNFAEGTGLFNFPERGGVHGRNRQRVQHHPGRAAEPHHPGRRGVLRSGPVRDRPQPDTRSRAALRMARHADRAGRPVRRVRRGHARRWCASASTSTRSISRTTRNFEPRLGVAWTPSADGRTVVRAAYRVGRRPAEHDGGQGHGRQSAVRDSVDGDRLDCRWPTRWRRRDPSASRR